MKTRSLGVRTLLSPEKKLLVKKALVWSLALGLMNVSGAHPQGKPRVPSLVPFSDGYVMLERPFEYVVPSTMTRIVVPAGFVTDLASIPPPFNLFFLKNKTHDFAAILHDYLYWRQEMCKVDADRTFEIALLDFGVEPKITKGMYVVVLYGGNSAWKDNARDRKQGLPRVIPSQHRTRIQIGTRWEPSFRKALSSDFGVKPSSTRPRPRFCH